MALHFFTLIYYIILRFIVQEQPKSPAEEQATFVLEPGLKIELVASEPMIQDPILMNFDEEGRLWVVEMRGYMPNVDAKGEDEPNGRISVLEDLNTDGMMDKATVFLDSLIMPRAMAFVKDGILVAENGALYQVLDKNNDLKPDGKTLIDKDYAGNPSPEHAGNGLLRANDGWFYNAKSKKRYRPLAGKWQIDSTEFRGQFGITQDDAGRLLYNYNWSQLHGDLVPPNYLWRNKNHTPSTGIDYGYTNERFVYPIRDTYASNRGYIPGTLDSKGRIREFTAACSPLVFRSNALGAAFYGNAFVCEPVGNLVKRNILTYNGPIPSANDPHPGKEFLASTDERFRPVSLQVGPDGALYVVDMYKGIMQHALYETPYLKEQYLKRGLDKHLHKGRIWRISMAESQIEKAPNFKTLGLDDLIQKLYASNAFERETAQRLLVDYPRAEATAKLRKIALRSPAANERVSIQYQWARFHAFNLLAILKKTDKTIVQKLVVDSFSPLANAALKEAELYAKADQVFTQNIYLALVKNLPNANPDQHLQSLLSASMFPKTSRLNFMQNVMKHQAFDALYRDATMSAIQGLEHTFLDKIILEKNLGKKPEEVDILIENLVAAILKNGQTTAIEGLLTGLYNGKYTGKKQPILTALAMQGLQADKTIALKAEPKLLQQLEATQREQIAKLFSWPGKSSSQQTTDARRLQKPEDLKAFARGRQQYLNVCSGCHGGNGQGMARLAPPLAGSEWVTGPEQKLALLVLHGIEGGIVVNGKKYDAPEILPTMPAMSSLDDATITNILTYIRNEWGNNAGPMSRGTVSRTRHTTQGRIQPWSVEALNRHVDSLMAIPKN